MGLAGHKTKYVKRSVEVEIGGHKFPLKITWLFKDRKTPVLIGRDIFEKFDVLFKQNPSRKVIFKRNKVKLN